MVSKASDDLPEPERPVITTSLSRGSSTSMFLRLWTRAPRTAIQSCAISLYRLYRGLPKGVIVPSGSSRSRGVLSGSSSSVCALEPAVPIAVHEVEDQPDRQPDTEPFPCLPRQPDHHVNARDSTDHRDRPHEAHPERPRP